MFSYDFRTFPVGPGDGRTGEPTPPEHKPVGSHECTLVWRAVSVFRLSATLRRDGTGPRTLQCLAALAYGRNLVTQVNGRHVSIYIYTYIYIYMFFGFLTRPLFRVPASSSSIPMGVQCFFHQYAFERNGFIR